jgi:hypothetical protein
MATHVAYNLWQLKFTIAELAILEHLNRPSRTEGILRKLQKVKNFIQKWMNFENNVTT